MLMETERIESPNRGLLDGEPGPPFLCRVDKQDASVVKICSGRAVLSLAPAL